MLKSSPISSQLGTTLCTCCESSVAIANGQIAMAQEDSDLRRRTAAKYGQDTGADKEQKENRFDSKSDKKSGFGVLDGLRLLTALLLVSLVASYFATRGQSFIWNAKRPWWTKPKLIQAYFVCTLLYTLEQQALNTFKPEVRTLTQ